MALSYNSRLFFQPVF